MCRIPSSVISKVETQNSYVLLACLHFVLVGGFALALPAMTEAALSHAPKAHQGWKETVLRQKNTVCSLNSLNERFLVLWVQFWVKYSCTDIPVLKITVFEEARSL